MMEFLAAATPATRTALIKGMTAVKLTRTGTASALVMAAVKAATPATRTAVLMGMRAVLSTRSWAASASTEGGDDGVLAMVLWRMFGILSTGTGVGLSSRTNLL